MSIKSLKFKAIAIKTKCSNLLQVKSSQHLVFIADLAKPPNMFCKITRQLFDDHIIIYTVIKNMQLATISMN